MSADDPEAAPLPNGPWEQPSQAHAQPQPPPPQPPYGYGPPPAWGYAPPSLYGYGPPQPQTQTEGLAIVVLVLSIASFFMFGFGVVMAVVALCLCPSARRSIEASKGTLTGEGFVTAAKAISWVNIALTALMVIGFIVFLILATVFDDADEFSALLAR
jgi:hypothetical protein